MFLQIFTVMFFLIANTLINLVLTSIFAVCLYEGPSPLTLLLKPKLSVDFLEGINRCVKTCNRSPRIFPVLAGAM